MMIKKNKDIIIIFSVFTILTVILLHKVKLFGGIVPDWDESHHLWMGYSYYKYLHDNNLSGFINLILNTDQIYPPLYHLAIGFCYFVFGVSPENGLLANSPFILILMLSIYNLGVVLGNKKAGLIASILTPLLPCFLTLQERVLIDYASVSLFVLAFYLLFKTDYFTNRKYSFLFGAAISLGLLIKWPFAIPGIPFVLYALKSVTLNKKKYLKILTNIFLTPILSIPSLTWYLFNYKYIIRDLDFFWDPSGFAQIIWANPTGFTFKNILLYGLYFPINYNGVGLIVLILFILALFLKSEQEKIKYLKLSVVITYIVLTILNDKSAYYASYYYPILMLITTFAIDNLKSKIFRNIFGLILISSMLINFGLSLNNQNTFRQFSVKINNKTLYILPNFNTRFVGIPWPTKQIAESIVNNKCQNNVLIFPDKRFVNFPNIRYFLSISGFQIITDQAYLFYNPAKDIVFNISKLNEYDCVISKTGDAGIFSNTKVLEFVNKQLLSNKNYKQLSFDAPDGSLIYLFIKKDE